MPRQAGEGGCRLRNQEPETSHELQVDGPTLLAPERSRLWFVVDPPDGRVPPLTREAERRAAARAEARAGLGDDEPRPGRWVEDLSPLVRCITRGLPAVYIPGAYNNNYQIVQSPGYVPPREVRVSSTRLGRGPRLLTARFDQQPPRVREGRRGWSPTSWAPAAGRSSRR